MGDAPSIWVNQGGKETIQSYVSHPEIDRETHINFFRRLHDYYICDGDGGIYAFVHGGWTSRMGLGHDERDTYRWDRKLWECSYRANKQYADIRTEM